MKKANLWLDSGGNVVSPNCPSPNAQIERALTLSTLDNLDTERERLAKLARARGFREVFCTWRGSVLPVIASSPQAWCDLTLYTVVSLLIQHLDHNILPELDTSVLALIGTIQGFFLTFFVTQNYSRLQAQYWTSKSCEGRLSDIAQLARVFLKRQNAQRVVRYANAAHLLAYLGLSDAYNGDNVLLEFNRKHILLTHQELSRLQMLSVDGGGAAFKEVIAWTLMEVRVAFEDSPDVRVKMELIKHALSLRGALGTLFDYAAFPVPFFYVHFVFFITGFYLSLFAYEMAFQFADQMWMGYLLVIANSSFVVGLRHIGRKFSDPYGNDIEDYPVMASVTSTLKGTRQVLDAMEIGVNDAATEEWMATGKQLPCDKVLS